MQGQVHCWQLSFIKFVDEAVDVLLPVAVG